MEYREDLFVTLLAGLPTTDQMAVMESIGRATNLKRRQIRRSAAIRARANGRTPCRD